MAQATGANCRLIYDSETTFKSTPGSPDAKMLPFNTESLRLSRNIFESRAITSSRNPKRPGRGNYDVAGDISFEMGPYIGTILRHALGSVATTGTGPYTHTLKVGALPTSMCIEKQFTDLATPEYFLYNGCRVNNFKLSYRSEGLIEGSISVMGAKETVSTSSFDSTPVDYGHLPFDAFEAAIQEGGSAIAIVTDVDVSIDNNLDGSVYTIGGGGERQALPSGMGKVSGTLKAMFDSMTLYTKATGHTETSLKLTLSRGTGGGSAGNESLEIFIPELVYRPQTPAITGPQGIFVDLPFEAYYDNSSEASAIQMILKNTVAAL